MSKKLSLEEAQHRIDTLFPNRFKLLSYDGNKSKSDFIWLETGDIDSIWFFKFALIDHPKHGRFPPSLRRDEFNKRKLSFQQRVENVFKNNDGKAVVKEYDSKTGMCLVEWDDGSVTNTSYCQLISKRTASHGSPSSKMKRVKQTLLQKYGVDHQSKVPEIALKMAKKCNNAVVKTHWKTGEDLICQGSYEAKTVDYLNNNLIDFEWQSKIFILNENTSYRPDFYLVKEDLWVEIKGFWRKDALEKWELFKAVCTNSEVWDSSKLKRMKII